MTWSTSLILPFLGLASHETPPEPSGVTAQRGPSWTGSIPCAMVTVSGRLQASATFVAQVSQCLQEKNLSASLEELI